jgi:predicted nucleic acid-binding protein
VTRYLLDTNVISNIARPAPSPSLLAWMSQQNDRDLFISSLSIGEILRGILQIPAGRRRNELESWFSGPQGPSTLFKDRILSFDPHAALLWARMMALGKATGHPRSPLDAIIAATAQTNQCVVVTDNQRDFPDVATLNPIRPSH